MPSPRHGSAPRFHVGTSGWHYAHWMGRFYPPDLPAERWLAFYAERFATVEINASFYRLPSREVFAHWRSATPADFLFAVKASRYLTHMKKLRDAEAPLATLLGHASGLGRTLGPILFQLPPRWRYDAARLEAFLAQLPQRHRYAFEFRDRSWLNDSALAALAARGAALCVYDLEGFTSPLAATADFVYVRLHGPGPSYAGSYSRRALSSWAGRLRGWADEGREVFCYFDNDQAAHAVHNALTLRELLDRP
jgi:uncharacterized protein YecE (DUF72 family)